MTRTVLVTGVAGFIGFHAALRLLQCGDIVVGLDNLNNYYDVSLKKSRLQLLSEYAGFIAVHADVCDAKAVDAVFRDHDIRDVIHLAAQVGVRGSAEAPRAYVDTNVVGFLNILESCRRNAVRHLVYASSSSVYGANAMTPYSVHHGASHPLSLYAATKRSNELMAHSYSHSFGLPTTGLRFFTVYGPWGRPDMAMFLFARAIVERRPIDVYGNGNMIRDFTFVDDVVEALIRVLDKIPQLDKNTNSMDGISSPAMSIDPYRIYNIGNDAPVRIMQVIEELEAALGRKAIMNFLPPPVSDMQTTHADVDDLQREVGYRPETDLHTGIRAFINWFCEYHGIEHNELARAVSYT